MENAADALKMAAAILIFIIAIASAFSLFGTAKQTADSIVGRRDKQTYLESAQLDNGILYTSSSAIEGNDLTAAIEMEFVAGVTTKGDRVVKKDDVFSTIYRYSQEKYGVTIAKKDGTVIARFDSATESVIAQYRNVTEKALEKFIPELNKNTKNNYVTNDMFEFNSKNRNTLYTIYGNCNAPWYGNQREIKKRVNADIKGEEYSYNGQTYQGKGLLNILKNASKIVEVTNEIDQSTYLEDNGTTTNLLQQYQMPIVEIIYIIY